MPHLRIECSANIEKRVDMAEFCRLMSDALMSTGLFPLGGIRVRAYPAEAIAIADGHAGNAFVDMVLRLGEGRLLAERRRTGETLIAAARAFLAGVLAEPHFALSLEIVEIDKALSWKINTIHPRLKTG